MSRKGKLMWMGRGLIKGEGGKGGKEKGIDNLIKRKKKERPSVKEQ